MTRNAIPDADERRIIEEELDTNLFVEAGAGSGKTNSLVRRIIALLATGRAEPAELAAITFTRKAAAELRQRLQERLEQALAAESDPDRRQRLDAANHRLGEAFVGTIHAFCARILREHPFEAGLDPEFSELEEGETWLFDSESWQIYLGRYQAGHPDFLEMIEEMDLRASDLEDIFHRLAQYPEAQPYWVERPAPEPEAINIATRHLLEALRSRFPDEKPDGGWDKVQQEVLNSLRLLRSGGPGESRRFRLVVESLMQVDAGQITLKRWADRDAGREAKDLLTRYQEDYGGPWQMAWREYCHGRIMPVVWPAVQFAAARRHENARVGFTDLLQGATALLRDHPMVRRRLAAQIRYLLVDEFQDTDPVQAEMMFLLTGAPVEECGWRRVAPRPGSLFIVGDPKQSIYRFRRADIATYQEVKERILSSGGRAVILTSSFRSLPALTGWVNEAFEDILPARADLYQAAFAPLRHVRSDDASDSTVSGVFKVSVPKIKWNSSNEIVRMDAARIAAYIAWACAGNLRLARTGDETRSGLSEATRPGDFLILLPRKQHIGVYAHALESVGLPCEISGGDVLGESPFLQNFLRVCDALADPEDPVKLLACLRGPLCGLSDAELYRFKAAGGRFAFLHVPESDDPVVEALQRLNRFWLRTRQEPPLMALEGILDELGLVPLAAGSANGHMGAGAITAAFEILRASNDAQVATFCGAVEALHQIVEAGEGEAVNMRPAPQRAVRLMNLHKAKGLEAPVVFLAAPTREKDHEVDTHVDRGQASPLSHYRISGGARVVGQPPGWDLASEEEGRFLRGEKDRLLYVAATRARNMLVVSRYEGNTEADLWAPLHPWLAGAEELPNVEANRVERPRITVNPEEVETELHDTLARRDACAVPGYRHLAVTALARFAPAPNTAEVASVGEEALAGEGAAVPDAPLATIPDGDSSIAVPDGPVRGAGWGTAVHRLLATVFKGLPQDRWSAMGTRILVEEALPAETLPALLDLVSRAWESPLGLRIRQAAEVYAEVPFGMPATRSELGLDSEGPELVLLEGAIDLVFREADGWVIVDYKTDMGALEGLEAKEQVVEAYSPQIGMYARFWRERLGEPVKESVLFFLRSMEAVRVE